MVYNYFGGVMYFLYDSIYSYSEDEYLSFYQKLSICDKTKVDLLVRNHDKRLFLLSRMLFSKLSLQYYGCDYFDLLIYYNDCGKPLTDKFYFNIAHSRDYAIVACSSKKIGVDIEKIRDVDNKMIDFFCNDKEKEYVLNSKDRNKAFFTLFCLKEAYFKMLGSSIRNFSDIEFTFHDDKIYCTNSNIYITVKYDILGYVFIIIEEKG